MKLPDANVLLYAIDEDSPRHEQARPWLESLLSGTETVAFAWTVLLAVVQLSTRPVAALAIEHGAEFCSSDADFSRFSGLRWVDRLR